MPTTKDEIKTRYPLPAYNYRVTIGTLTLGVAEVSGLSLGHDIICYQHGMSFVTGVKLIPGMSQQVKLTLKRGVCQRDDAFYIWFREIYNSSFATYQREVLIDLCDEVGSPLVRWKVQGAIPSRIDAPTFSATSNEVAIETIELFAQDVQVEYL